MKNTSLLLLALILQFASQAQDKLLSTKLLQSSGMDEIYKVTQVQDGFLCLGLKGDAQHTKKLWISKLNSKLQIQYTNTIEKNNLADPFEVIKLPNGKNIILAQENDANDFSNKSLILCVDNNGNLLWAKNFELNHQTHLTNATLITNNEIVFVGVQQHVLNSVDQSDKLVLLKTTDEGNIIWSNKLDIGNAQILPKNILCASNTDIIVSGTYTRIDNEAKNENCWFANSFDAEGEFKNSIVVDDYASYNYAQALVEHNNKYVAILNNKDYYGDAAIVHLNKNLTIAKSYILKGTPILLSGVFSHNKQLVFSGVFSNTTQHFAPGFISVDEGGNVLAKSSKTLFSHFFITNTLITANKQFLLNGIGYNKATPSDVYILPFTADGKSACEMEVQKMKLQYTNVAAAPMPNAILEKTTRVSNTLKYMDLKTSIISYQLIDVCTAPDDLVFDANDNQSWKDWNENNAKEFEVKKITEWLEIFPNPTKGIIKISYNGTANENGLRTTIFNNAGKLVHTEIVTNHDVFEVDISDKPNGIYIVKVFDGIEEKMQKIVKQ